MKDVYKRQVPPHQSPNAKAAQAGSHGYVGGYHWEVHWHPHGRPDWQPLRVQGGVSGGNGLGGGAITGSQLPVGISRLDADCAVSQQIGFQRDVYKRQVLGFEILVKHTDAMPWIIPVSKIQHQIQQQSAVFSAGKGNQDVLKFLKYKM